MKLSCHINIIATFLVLSGISLSLKAQEDSKLKWENGEMYMVVHKNSDQVKKPLGKNVKIYYDTFFKSVTISFTDSEAFGEKNNSVIELKYVDSDGFMTFYKSTEGIKYWCANPSEKPVTDGRASFSSYNHEPSFSINVRNLERDWDY